MCKFGVSKVIIGKDGKQKLAVFKCGRCSECLAEKRKDYVQRAFLEVIRVREHRFTTKHWTFSYSQDALAEMKSKHCAQSDFMKFVKRLRKYISKTYPNYPPIRLLRVAELGQDEKFTHRLHWHVVFFNIPYISVSKMREIWKNGGCYVRLVEEPSITINYVTKYVTKTTMSNLEKELYGIKRTIICSQHCGVGVLSPKKIKELSKSLRITIGKYPYKISKYLCTQLFCNEETNSETYCNYINQKQNQINYVREKQEKEVVAPLWLRYRSRCVIDAWYYNYLNSRNEVRRERLFSENAELERSKSRFRLHEQSLSSGYKRIISVPLENWL